MCRSVAAFSGGVGLCFHHTVSAPLARGGGARANLAGVQLIRLCRRKPTRCLGLWCVGTSGVAYEASAPSISPR
jgi:hypothetical protein